MNEAMPQDAERRLPVGEEIFLDHVGHFVSDVQAAADALFRIGFLPTPLSRQANPDPAGGPPQPNGIANITIMLDRGYLEILFKTAETPFTRDFDVLLARYQGVRLAAFSVTDAAAAHARLSGSGFALQPLVSMQRQVKTVGGDDIAAFTIARPAPGTMPEGRIQILTHRTEPTVWQPRWLTHPIGVTALLDMVIATTDTEEAANRFGRFLGRDIRRNRVGPVVCLDRGRVQFVAAEMLAEHFPGIAVPDMPFMAVYGLAVRSLWETAGRLRQARVPFYAQQGAMVVAFPEAVGAGAWVFVENAADLPWRR
jgi:Glyoxalase-like domain